MNSSGAHADRNRCDGPAFGSARAAVAKALDGIAGADLGALSDDHVVTLLGDLADAARLLDGVIVSAAAEVQERSRTTDKSQNLACKYGFRNANCLIEAITGRSAFGARMWTSVASATSPRTMLTGEVLDPDFPSVAAALRTGAISVDTAHAITNTLTPVVGRATPESLLAADRGLTDLATGNVQHGPGAGVVHTCEQVRAAAKMWRDAIDPDGVEPRAERAHRRRSFTIARRAVDGLHRASGHLPTDIAAQYFSLLDALTDEQFREGGAEHLAGDNANTHEQVDNGDMHNSVAVADAHGVATGGDAPRTVTKGYAHRTASSGDADRTASSGDADRAATEGDARENTRPLESRTYEQSGADVFAAMIGAMHAVIAGGDAFATPAPVLVTIEGASGTGSETHLAGQVGSINGEPAPGSMIDQLACDGGIQPVRFGPGRKVIALETQQRLFTANQRKAIAARDGHTCLIPHCRIPAQACQAHHVIPYSEGGRTTVSNGVLLCWAHHRMLDHEYWTITMDEHGCPVTTVSINPPRRYHMRT